MCAEMKVEGKHEPNPGRVLAGMETQRKLRRKRFQPVFGRLEEEGIDSKGNTVLTRKLGSFGIYEPYKGVVRVHFRRNETGPRTITTTDVYRAVRMAAHIEENYVAELDKNDSILKTVGMKNLYLAANIGDRDEIKETLRELRKVSKSLKGLRVPEKKFSKKQLEDAIGFLRNSMRTKAIDERKVGWACTKLVSFRTRYGNWRDEEIVAIREYSKLRGCTLRKLRDERLLENIANWKRYLETERRGFQMRALWTKDLFFSKEVEGLLERKRMHPEELTEAKEKLAKAGYRVRKIEDAEELLWKTDDMKEKLAAIKYRPRKTDEEYKQMAKWKKEARRQMRDYMLLLRVRNPLYVAEEMKKETDAYYGKAADYLEKAAELIQRKVFDRAVYCLEKAADEIKKRGATPQTSFDFPSQSR